MTHTQEEHRIRLYPSHSHRDSFTSLWTTIARQQHFLRLTFSDTDTPTKEQIQEAIRHRSGSISPYTSAVFHTYQVIYEKRGCIILTNQPTTTLGTFFAVEDSDNPHRYFIAFAFSVGAMTESITGLFVYFNNKGFCSSDRTVISQRVLSTYDMRNGMIRESNIFLYHQSLAFTQIHRDTRKLLLYLNHIPYQTEAIENHTSYYTNYTLPYTVHNWGESITLFKRYLYIPLAEGVICFDLGSLVVMEDTADTIQRYFTLQSYQTRKEDVRSFLELASLFPEEEYSDGYPLYCEQCHEKTVTATYEYKASPYASIQSGLGASYCPHCRIRYSDSKKCWVCAQIHLDGSTCNGYLLDKTCRLNASHSSDQTLIMLYDMPLLKYPYREKVRIQWIPSQDALICAKTSRLTIAANLYASDTPPKDENEIL